jgi:SAM-dependent methyltransferase
MTAKARYEDITETTGTPVTREALDMMYTRYALAAEMARGARVLELGCGAGQGLGLIAEGARIAVGGDYSGPLLDSARRHYGARIPFVRLSAESLPFKDASFDLVLFFEATYYIPDMNRAFDEIDRILGARGTVMFVNANPERPDFIRSPFSTHYHSAGEFRKALSARGFEVAVAGAFPITPASRSGAARPALVGRALGIARRILEGLHLVPRTLKGRARLKRLLYGKLLELPAELRTGAGSIAPRASLQGDASGFKVLYVTGRKRTTGAA